MITNLTCGIVGIVINIIIIDYVRRLENKKCDCSVDWRRDYIKMFAILSLAICVVLFFTRSGLKSLIKTNSPMKYVFYVITVMYSIGMLVNVYALFSYSQKIACKLKCECSKGWARSFLYYYSMFIAVMYITLIVSAILIVIAIKTNPKLKGKFNFVKMANSSKKLKSNK